MTPSSKYLFLFLFAAASQFPSITFSQTISTAKLIEALQTDDVYQTEKFGAVCTDLSLNFNENAFSAKLKEIQEYLIRKPDPRLHIRTFMYGRIGHDKISRPDTLETAENYFELIKRASLLGDEQLLSELYSNYAAITTESDKLYYLLKCLEIQDRIKAKYFRDISSNYYKVCELLYTVGDYKSSAHYGAKGTALWLEKDKVDYLHLYILAADLTGASYLKINKPDSALFYYKQISKLVNQRIANPGNYRLEMAPDVLRIWQGIAKGGIGKVYLLQGNYDEAYSLLKQNLNSSTSYNQWDDVANALTSMATIDEMRHNTLLALSKYLKAYSIALKSTKLTVLVASAQGASNAFAMVNKYDSAYVYHTKYLSWKDSLEKISNRSRLDIVKAQVNFEQMQKALQKSQDNLDNQKRIRNSILAGILFLTAIALLLYNRKTLQLNLQTEKLEKEKQKADSEIVFAQQQISHFTNNIAKKNNLITQLQTQLTDNSNSEITIALSQFVILTEDDWQEFKINFEKINPGFIKKLKLKMPNITPAEQRIILLAKLGFNTKEMANANGVSSETIRSVVSRMRKKFNLETDIHTIANEL